MKPTRRQSLVVASIVTLGLVAWTAWNDRGDQSAIAEVVSKRAQFSAVHGSASVVKRTVRGPVRVTGSDADEWMRDPLIVSDADPFKVVSFLPPPPKVVVLPPPPPPKPTAPPFPYRYFGRMANVDGKLVTYLTRDDALVAVSEKQMLDTDYRVDSMTETQIVVMYLPLQEKTVISTQSSRD